MKLDKTKVYYLGDLSDEQLEILGEWYETVKVDSQSSGVDIIWFKTYYKTLYFAYTESDNEYIWGFCNELNISKPTVNALTLFTQTKYERIAQIQLRIQELNNELIELDEEMRKLGDDKKED